MRKQGEGTRHGEVGYISGRLTVYGRKMPGEEQGVRDSLSGHLRPAGDGALVMEKQEATGMNTVAVQGMLLQ